MPVRLAVALLLIASALPAQVGFSTAPAPTPPLNGMMVWYDAQCITYSHGCVVPANAANVSTWYDRSGNNNPMTYSIGTIPTYSTNVINGLGAMNMINCRCGFTADTIGTGTTIFIVMKPNDVTTGHSMVASSNNTAVQWYHSSAHQGFNSIGITTVGTGTATLNTSGFQQMNVAFTNNSSSIAFRYARAADALSGSATSTNITSANNLFADDNPNSTMLNAAVAEFIFYNRRLSTTEIGTVEGYLFNKYGI